MSDYRSEVETLRAENARLTVFAAGLEARMRARKEREKAKVPMRWAVTEGHSFFHVASGVVIAAAVFFVGGTILGFLFAGLRAFCDVLFLRGVVVMATFALAWCLAFVRRVPR